MQMDAMVFTLIMFGLGFLAAQAPIWLDRKRRIRAHLHALRAEILLCQVLLTSFLTSQITSPLYRFPIAAFERALPLLLTEGTLKELEVMRLSRFASVVQELNRGLDEAAEYFSAGKQAHLEKAFQRNMMKAERLANGYEDESAIAPDALQIVTDKIKLRWWKY